MEQRRYRNYHTHTARCGHARDTDEQYVLSAISAGYEVLGFADHTPWPWPEELSTQDRMRPEELSDYLDSVRTLRDRYADRIRLHVGLECEYFPELLPWLRETKAAFGVEYCILGQHRIGATEPSFFRKPQTAAGLHRYADTVCEAMETGEFVYMAHPELPMTSYPVFDADCAEISRQICETAKQLDMPLEYNLLGELKREQGKHSGLGYPNDFFWEIAAEVGVKAIVGMDAHFCEALRQTYRIDRAWEKLSRLGISIADTIPGVEEA